MFSLLLNLVYIKGWIEGITLEFVLDVSHHLILSCIPMFNYPILSYLH